jgi:TolB-like protein
MSPDPNDEYFAEGITEEIISTVSGISGLNVISRTSVMQYKKTEKTVKQIGKELEVGSLLEGSLRKAGNKIRVTTQLIDVAADKHLWAQNYDRNLDDVFEVQSDVAKQVADALQRHPPPAIHGRRVRIRYMTQTKSRPPTFALFGTQLKALPESYLRYLQNGLRDAFELKGVPIRFSLRTAKNPYAE